MIGAGGDGGNGRESASGLPVVMVQVLWWRSKTELIYKLLVDLLFVDSVVVEQVVVERQRKKVVDGVQEEDLK